LTREGEPRHPLPQHGERASSACPAARAAAAASSAALRLDTSLCRSSQRASASSRARAVASARISASRRAPARSQQLLAQGQHLVGDASCGLEAGGAGLNCSQLDRPVFQPRGGEQLGVEGRSTGGVRLASLSGTLRARARCHRCGLRGPGGRLSSAATSCLSDATSRCRLRCGRGGARRLGGCTQLAPVRVTLRGRTMCSSLGALSSALGVAESLPQGRVVICLLAHDGPERGSLCFRLPQALLQVCDVLIHARGGRPGVLLLRTRACAPRDAGSASWRADCASACAARCAPQRCAAAA